MIFFLKLLMIFQTLLMLLCKDARSLHNQGGIQVYSLVKKKVFKHFLI